MCKKSQEQCKAKTKCKCCTKPIDNELENDKLNLSEVDNQFEQQHYVIDIKGE